MGPREIIGYIVPNKWCLTNLMHSNGKLIPKIVTMTVESNIPVKCIFLVGYIKDLEQYNIPKSCLAITEEENDIIIKIIFLMSLRCI